MKTAILFMSVALLAGCSMRDTVNIEEMTTTQAYDLSDKDGDGVIEARERCNDTAKGAGIDNYGCGQIKAINERKDINILFPNDSAYIAPEYYPQIEEIAMFLRQYPTTKVTIEGHTSRTGTDERNAVLSQERADAVTAVLADRFSIDRARLTAIGYGSSRPLVLERTPDAETRNRRVVAEVTGDDTTADMKWTIYSVDETTK
ncbi:OmpA family protein [Shewanella mangrovisoli]|uniref:OmpA family protein n=1 Tax=Shewanella mangrovisoli TaxID=2864211 RepID=UPI001C66062D|nr:OmpA family protein [Shewanella mangrovisoli]QYK09531.1 OmpA family protein [Shewanella mangrovisoli]